MSFKTVVQIKCNNKTITVIIIFLKNCYILQIQGFKKAN